MKNLWLNIKLSILLGCTLVLLSGTWLHAEEIANEVPLELLLFEDPTIVIASKTAQKVSEAPSIVTVITGQEIENMGARNLEDVFRFIVGFMPTPFPGYNDTNIILRGLLSNNNKIKFMLNGQSMSSFDGSPAFYLNYISLKNIKAIEIIRGPGSALYGENAFLGVVNIITKDTLGNGKLAKASVQGGNFNTWRSTAEFSQQSGDLNLYLMADYHRSDGPKLRVETDRATKRFGTRYSAAPGDSHSNFETYSVQSNINYQHLRFSAFLLNLKANTPFGFLLALTDENFINFPVYMAELGYQQAVFENLVLDLKTYYNFHGYSAMYEHYSEQTAALFAFPEGEGMSGGPSGKYSLWGSELTLENKILPGLMLVGGALYEYSKWYDITHILNYNAIGRPLVIDGITYAPNQYLGGYKDIGPFGGNWSKPAFRNTSAVYGQVELDFRELISKDLGQVLTLTTGLRYDNYDDIGSSSNPRISLVYSPFEPLTAKIMYGTAFRVPSFRELYNINNPSFVGNPDLKPENVTTLEGQVGYKLNKNLESTVSVFNTNIQDNIQFVRLGIPYENAGKILSQGVEAEVRYKLEAKKYAFINGTYQNAKNITHLTITNPLGGTYTQEDFAAGYVPDYIANFGVNYDFLQNLSANFTVNYIGERKRKGEKAFNTAGELVLADPRDPLPAIFLANLSVWLGDFDFFKPLEVRLSVYNLFNVNHRDPEPSNTLANDLPRPARTYAAEVSCSF